MVDKLSVFWELFEENMEDGEDQQDQSNAKEETVLNSLERWVKNRQKRKDLMKYNRHSKMVIFEYYQNYYNGVIDMKHMVETIPKIIMKKFPLSSADEAIKWLDNISSHLERDFSVYIYCEPDRPEKCYLELSKKYDAGLARLVWADLEREVLHMIVHGVFGPDRKSDEFRQAIKRYAFRDSLA